jgi:hypothetical protein
MSNPVRIAFVMEGSTDYVVLLAALRSLLDGRDFELTSISPELDESLRPKSEGGWGSVFKWCRQVVEQAGGPARENPLFALNDVIIAHVDADVAGKKYKDCNIKDPPNNDLPCEKPCPPATNTTNALRNVVLGWLSERDVPPKMVLCTPSKSIETWLLVALFPDDDSAKKADIECRGDCEVRLRKYGLIKSGQKLIDKYHARERDVQNAWPAVRETCSEADRFSREFMAWMPPTNNA